MGILVTFDEKITSTHQNKRKDDFKITSKMKPIKIPKQTTQPESQKSTKKVHNKFKIFGANVGENLIDQVEECFKEQFRINL